MKSILDYTIIAEFLSFSSRERIIYELSSPKKRLKALERFSHNVDSVINPECICFKGKVISDAIKSEIKNSAAECVVLSLEHQQGKKMIIEDALEYLSYECTVVIVVIGNWLILKPEYEGGEGLLYVLKKKQ